MATCTCRVYGGRRRRPRSRRKRVVVLGDEVVPREVIASDPTRTTCPPSRSSCRGGTRRRPSLPLQGSTAVTTTSTNDYHRGTRRPRASIVGREWVTGVRIEPLPSKLGERGARSDAGRRPLRKRGLRDDTSCATEPDPMMKQMVGAVRLDAAAYEEVEQDKSATGQAAFLVVATARTQAPSATRHRCRRRRGRHPRRDRRASAGP